MSLTEFGASVLTALTKRFQDGVLISFFRRAFTWTGYTKVSNRWVYFRDEEVEGLDLEFVAKLDMGRKNSGIPWIITRGKSTPEHNAEVGGVSDSAHLTGLAVDLSADNSASRFYIVTGALAAGINRIGVYDRHVHLDADTTKPAHVLWLGQDK